MPIDLSAAEAILRSDLRLHQIYSQKYEISFESSSGKQIALNRRTLTQVGVWIENLIDPRHLGLSPSTAIEHYPASKPRAHLSAGRLTGPYKSKRAPSRAGNDCWYLLVREESDFRTLLSAYF